MRRERGRPDKHGGFIPGAGPSREGYGPKRNIVLIGVPGAGKSTAGTILAKALGMQFVDTDTLIRERYGRPLQEILDCEGPEGFLEAEEETILSGDFQNAVVATGGSVVFRSRAMERLREHGTIVFLDIPYSTIAKRLGNIAMRGVVLFPGESLRAMYNERIPLYRKYADITIACSGRTAGAVVQEIADEVCRYRKSRQP